MRTLRLRQFTRLAVVAALAAISAISSPTAPALAAGYTACTSSTDFSCDGKSPTTCPNPGSVSMPPNPFWKADTDPASDWMWGMRFSAPDLHGIQTYVGYMQLRYSPTCRANWARLRFLEPGWHGELSVWNPGRPSQKTWIGYDHSGNWFTPTVNGILEACIGMQVFYQGIWRAWVMGYCV